MKKFKVTMATMQARPQGETVTVLGAQVTIEADYFRVQDGALFFRRVAGRGEQYNPAVRVFAPGFWAEVVEVAPETPKQAVERPMQQHHAREIDFEPDCLSRDIVGYPGPLEGSLARPSGQWGASWDD